MEMTTQEWSQLAAQAQVDTRAKYAKSRNATIRNVFLQMRAIHRGTDNPVATGTIIELGNMLSERYGSLEAAIHHG